MTVVTERARAKINLTLSILGRRPDGYHALLSLVAFAGAADDVTLNAAAPTGVTVTGPFAAAISGVNLIDMALTLVADAVPDLTIGHVTLDKNLPVASGVGGGSSDAAAVLRAIRKAHPAATADIDWSGIAQRLGADVPVCFNDRAAWMSGAGETLHTLDTPLPRLDAVLVNPQAPVPANKTARVFRALGAPPLAANEASVPSAIPAIPDRAELLALMARIGNDLEAPATAVVPEIEDVITALEACPGLRIARLSGAGPTCFAIFDDAPSAETAAAALATDHPGWWIAPVVIG
ncbi:MAG: 4-(cytidine 5'-diphospho)-2-C-methyl-D-erythritol kinase [Hyphomicrobium sp. 32-62-53]|nr:MAG: 4-(cytidine 5'-diphospho)-2-C-methyl-D-erythritol kinase [Hyphomicrobium sp. 12-62-95]OYX99228.1 MAG: 4-(cytidine 5'-diphospho)-2-C-methyl-D-erythritol kinase [Hyphomicrobium sp. 32-62-53]